MLSNIDANNEDYFYIDILPALSGDCIMIRCSNSKGKTNILIDGGFKDTYSKFIKPYLNKLKDKRESIDLLVVTHIDSDHIRGIIELFKDFRENGEEKFPKIKEIWFNALKQLLPKSSRKTGNDINEQSDHQLKEMVRIGQATIQEEGYSVVSAEEGEALCELLEPYEKEWNTSFGHKAVCLKNGSEEILINKQVKIKLLSPSQEKLQILLDHWLKVLKDKNVNQNNLFDKAFECFSLTSEDKSEYEEISASNFDVETLKEDNKIDKAPPNGSSIALSLEFAGREILLLGDAHPDLLEESLAKQSKKVYKVIKVSHHGSKYNTTLQLAKLMKSESYIFLTNGAHHHPNLEALARIVSDKIKKFLVFNYKTSSVSKIDKDKIKKEYNYEVKPFLGDRIIRLDVETGSMKEIELKEI